MISFYKLNVKIYDPLFVLFTNVLFTLINLPLFTLYFYFLCVHIHMLYYGMCTVSNENKLLLLVVVVSLSNMCLIMTRNIYNIIDS